MEFSALDQNRVHFKSFVIQVEYDMSFESAEILQ